MISPPWSRREEAMMDLSPPGQGGPPTQARAISHTLRQHITGKCLSAHSGISA